MPVLSRPLCARRNGVCTDKAPPPEDSEHLGLCFFYFLFWSPQSAAAFGGAGGPRLGPGTPEAPRGDLRPVPRATGAAPRFGPQPDGPGPQSQSFSRSYGSTLPTSLTYIVPSTRGCSPWRPAADIGYGPARKSHFLPRIFKGRREHTGRRRRRGALRACRSHLRPNRFRECGGSYEEKKTLLRLPRRRLRVRLRRRTRTRAEAGPLSVSGSGNINPVPFRSRAPSREKRMRRSSERISPIPRGRLTHVRLPFTWNPSPLRSSRVSLEYLLLPPRSAPEAAPGGLAPGTFDARLRDPPTRRGVR